MKSILILIFSLVCIGTCNRAVLHTKNNAVAVEGGAIRFDFEDKKQEASFASFSSLGTYPKIVDGHYITSIFGENKIIYKEKSFDDFTLSVDIGGATNSTRIDSGVYFQIGDVYSGVDFIEAFNLHLIKNEYQNTMMLILYKFDMMFLGEITLVEGIPFDGGEVHLVVTSEAGILNSYIKGFESMNLTYNIGQKAGRVGLRNYYTCNTFDNLEIISRDIAVDYSALISLIGEGNNLLKEEITPNFRCKLTATISKANGLLNSTSQILVDEMCDELKDVMNDAVHIHSFAELSTLLTEAKQITNDAGKYTENAWSTLQKIIVLCDSFTSSSDIEDVSYWYERLEEQVSSMVEYIV